MASAFVKEFDEWLNQILTDYANQDSSPDTSQGSVVFIQAACLASCLWGLNKFLEYVGKQAFPDTADTANLNHHGYLLGIDRQPTDTDQTYLAKILSFLRQPPAGGNANDLIQWALDTPAITGGYYVATATVVAPPAVTPGTAIVVIDPNDENILGTADMTTLVAAVQAYIDPRRPVTANEITVLAVVPLSTVISLTVHGDSINQTGMISDIIAYVNSLPPGKALTTSALISIAATNGSEDTTVNSPFFGVYPTSYQAVRCDGTPTITIV